jgi:starch phosphorylase
VRILGKVTVFPVPPEPLVRLSEIAYNLWWSWNPSAQALYRDIDPELWDEVNHNPVLFLRRAQQQALDAAAEDEEYMERYQEVMDAFDAYMDPPARSTWFARAHPGADDHLIAYFSAEFGLHESLPIYSGGLGILSGDHCKTASDLGLPFVGVGFIYPQGYFRQQLDRDGVQQANYEKLDFGEIPATPALGPGGKQALIHVELPGRRVYAKVWRIQVGRIPIYLMDTDVPENAPEDRELSARLYGGDREMRLSQEIVLGIGGVRALRALGLKPAVWHINEGHAAFLQLERMREYVQEDGLSFEAALWAARADAIFTTHTPVPAGNDAFAFDLVDRYFRDYWPLLGLERASFMDVGRYESPWGPQFGMTVLALRSTGRANGVSALHGEVARKMWAGLWPEIPAQEVPIGHVTNGVHTESWMHPGLAALLDRHLDSDWRDRLDEPALWHGATGIPDVELWQEHTAAREELLEMVRERLARQLARERVGAAAVEAAAHVLEPEALTIGFARRFATYKRATLLFRDPARLLRILNDPERPVQFIFAGKAHPADEPGKAFIQAIYQYSRQPEYAGKIVFVEDYDINLARKLVAGVDVWLNNPRRPHEASGTSGQKAGLNGVLNFSALDGWWVEGFDGQNGWAIGSETDYLDEASQDEADALSLYTTLEEEIIPLFFERDERGLPVGWLDKMQASMATVGPNYSTHRMLKDYVNDYYTPAAELGAELQDARFARTRALAEWEARVRAGWESITLSAQGPSGTQTSVGQPVAVSASLRPGKLSPDDLAVELVYGQHRDGKLTSAAALPMTLVGTEGGAYLYEASEAFPESGSFGYGVRVRADHPDLPNPFAANLVTWA